MSRAAGAARAPIGTIVLLGLAGLLHALMIASLVDADASDAAGRGLAQAFATLVGLLLWIVLAALVAVAAVKGHMPLAGIVAAAFLLPASAVGAFAAASLYDREQSWPLAVIALLPPLFALYAVWARWPSLQKALPPLPATLALGVSIFTLTALPLGLYWRQTLPDPARDARLAAEQKAREEAERQRIREAQEQEAAAFARLGPDSSLGDYLDYLYGDRAAAALQGIRAVKSRQADAVVLLQRGRLHDLAALHDFNLEAAPDLCRAYGEALAAAAAQVSPRQRTDYLSAAMDLEEQLANIRWLAGAGCDLGQPLALLEANVRAVADSGRMTGFADALAGIRTAK
ncbi:MAG: hypothetical protein JSR90_13620 [Proteobacteria bacterium]|nr:hypothetical protein [Pseudomonadota bacterium]